MIIKEAAAELREARRGKRVIGVQMAAHHYDALDLLVGTNSLSARDCADAAAALDSFSRSAGAQAPMPAVLTYSPAGGGGLKTERSSSFTPRYTSGNMNACFANAVAKHVTGSEVLGVALRTAIARTASALHDIVEPLQKAGKHDVAAALLGVSNATLPRSLEVDIAELRGLAKGTGTHMLDQSMAFLLAVATGCTITVVASTHGFECVPPLHDGPTKPDTIWLFYDAERIHYVALQRRVTSRAPLGMRAQLSRWYSNLRAYARKVIHRVTEYDDDVVEVVSVDIAASPAPAGGSPRPRSAPVVPAGDGDQQGGGSVPGGNASSTGTGSDVEDASGSDESAGGSPRVRELRPPGSRWRRAVNCGG